MMLSFELSLVMSLIGLRSFKILFPRTIKIIFSQKTFSTPLIQFEVTPGNADEPREKSSRVTKSFLRRCITVTKLEQQ
jgi:hypothetical protein